jgi:hypothetical protein
MVSFHYHFTICITNTEWKKGLLGALIPGLQRRRTDFGHGWWVLLYRLNGMSAGSRSDDAKLGECPIYSTLGTRLELAGWMSTVQYVLKDEVAKSKLI